VSPPLWYSAGPLLAASVAAFAAVTAHRAIAIDAAPAIHLAAFAAVLAIYLGGLWLWQRATGESLRLTGFRAA
jgi:hypothetical protein